MPEDFSTTTASADADTLSADGSEVRFLAVLDDGGLSLHTLAPQRVSRAVVHRTVEEIWYCIAGRGQVWRRQGVREEVVDLTPGVAITIPVGTHFQYRNTGHGPLEVVVATMPPTSGNKETAQVGEHWPVDGAS